MLDNKITGDRIIDGDVIIETVVKDKNFYDDMSNIENRNENNIDDSNIVYQKEVTIDNKTNDEKTSDTNANNNTSKIDPKSNVYQIININTASQSDLTKLPGIGSSTADKIIAYRTNKPFSKIEDIKNVSGIGDAKFNKIKKYIEV